MAEMMGMCETARDNGKHQYLKQYNCTAKFVLFSSNLLLANIRKSNATLGVNLRWDCVFSSPLFDIRDSEKYFSESFFSVLNITHFTFSSAVLCYNKYVLFDDFCLLDALY